MHGAVTDYVGYKGEPYSVSLGVALHSIRAIAQATQRDKVFAMELYGERARELKLASLWLVDGAEVTSEELDFWGDGLLNTEVCEEAAFALLRYVEGVDRLLYSDKELACYAALVTMSYLPSEVVMQHCERIVELAAIDSHHMAYGVVLALESAARGGRESLEGVKQLLAKLSQYLRGEYICDELTWRLEIIEDEM